MPGVLAASDRKLLIITGIVLFVLIVLVSLVSPQPRSARESSPSSYASDSGGALAAYTLLQEMHRGVSRWEAPPDELPEDSEDAVLIIADPTQTPTTAEQAALMNFVEGRRTHSFHRPGRGRIFYGGNGG